MSSNDQATHQKLLFVGTHGHVVAIDKQSGDKVWERSLPGTGYAVVSIVYEDGRLFCASGGRIFAIDPGSGEVVWKNKLKGLGMGIVYLSTAASNSTEMVMSLLAQAGQDAQRSAGQG